MMMADVKREFMVDHHHHHQQLHHFHQYNSLPNVNYYNSGAVANDELWDLKNVSYPGFESINSDQKEQFDNNNLLADLDSLSDADHLEDVDYVKNIMMQIQTTCAPPSSVTANHFALHANHHNNNHVDFDRCDLGETHVLNSDYGSEGAQSDGMIFSISCV